MFGGLLVTFSKLIGKKVIGSNAVVLGEVHGADVDTDKWQITHLHVGLADDATRELGFKKPCSARWLSAFQSRLFKP
jgi:sporulation protein YlmC with PRC-barrel domain